MKHRFSFLLLFVFWLVVLDAFTQAAPNAVFEHDPIQQDRDALYANYRKELSALVTSVSGSEKLPKDKQSKTASILRGWLPPRPAFSFVLFNPNDIPRNEKEAFHLPIHPSNRVSIALAIKQFQSLRKKQAENLFRLATRAANDGNASLAMQLALETLRENPNHAEARRVLGYTLEDGIWQTAYQKRKAATGYLWHSKFGWIRKQHLAKYESGKRPLRGSWVSVADDTKARANITKGWKIRTQHFMVTTNAGLSEGVALSQRLETLNALWEQVFADFLFNDQEIKQLFAGKRKARKFSKSCRVIYYRNREEYNAALIRRQPKIGMTLGIYFDRQSQSHFFAGKEQLPATIFHETTHQLFQERRISARNIGALDNFWAIEGIATYMESLEKHSKNGMLYYTLGGPTAGRIIPAKQRVLVDGYYVPLAELVNLGKHDLQKRPDIAKLYSEAAGLSTFFMHAEEAKYREAFIEYLKSIYTGKANAKTLFEETKADSKQLDREYRKFLEALPE